MSEEWANLHPLNQNQKRILMKKLMMLCLAVCCSAVLQAQVPARPLPFRNPELSPEQRADDLLRRLTLEEKVALMQNKSKGVPRLGVKPYEWWNEALHGVARAGLATVFPQSIGMGASFHDSLVYEVFDAVSDEARVKNRIFNAQGSYRRYQGLTFWTPNVNIFRDPRWGRGQETYGEDPYLTGQMGMAVVRGLQGSNDTKYNKAHACAKHFAVHSGPEWCRHSFNAENIPFRELWETYLPAFKDLVQKAGVKEVMCAYNRFEGEPCCGSDRLLHQILRNEWGFNGIVVTDCGAVSDFWQKHKHGVYPDASHASVAAVSNGTDLECGSNFDSLADAVRRGLIEEERIDNSVRRLLKARFELGEMEAVPPFADIPDSVIDCGAHRKLALRMARETMVLLQNNGILPLKPGMTVALVGPNANDSVMQWGNYNGTPSHTVTLLQAMRQRLPEEQLIYEPGCGHTGSLAPDSLALLIKRLRRADVVVFAGGISPKLEGESMKVTVPGFKGGDRTTIELPGVQRELMLALKRAGKRVVMVNFSGSAMGLKSETETCDAILQAWYPGQEGGTAVADVLFGDYNPGGRLPVTFYASDSQLPDFLDYSMKNRTYRYFKDRPLFAFGYGLSYTTFRYGEVVADRDTLAYGDTLRLRIPVTNTGAYDGDEVVQVYLRRPDDAEGPLKALRGFRRVHLPRSATREVVIDIPYERFEWFDTRTNSMHPMTGVYEVLCGGSSRDEDLKSRVRIYVR